MLMPPPGLDSAALRHFIGAHWPDHAQAHEPLIFLPVGKDSWNFRAGELFVSLRRDLRGHVGNAYRALHDLVARGQIAAIAPLPSCTGSVVETFGQFPVLVYPYLVHRSLEGRADAAALRGEVLACLHRVHRAQTEIDLPRETFSLPFRASLLEVLAKASGPSSGPSLHVGPFASAAQRAIAEAIPAIKDLLGQIDDLAATCRADKEPFVLTHGEPLPANIIETAEKGLRLIDFTELAWGPPERDHFHLAARFGWEIGMRPAFRDFYRLKWQLSEIEEYGQVLLSPHSGSADDSEMYEELRRYLPGIGAAVA